MGIVAEDIERVRAATDFVAVAGEHIALRRVGRRWTGLCPFHAEKSPSFSINPESNLYYCFGCGAGGDVITFVRELEHLEFAEAVEHLAAKAGIQVRHDTTAVSEQRRRREVLLEAMRRAVDWYHQRLLTGPDAATARAYLRSRGYDGEVVRAYKLGWAPDSWDALSRALGLPDDVLHDAGLGLVNRIGRQQDDFRARVMFPIFDVRGDPVAFGGRALPGSSQSKYRNSRETPLYSKSRILYGLNWAKAAVVESGEVVVCEGYTDVIGLARAGVPQAVATCGTALADDHVRTLRNFARRLVLAYDADTAGQAAAARFYEWERRYELDIAVADLPSGADPADLAARDPAALRAAVAGARRFLAFRLERVLAGGDLRTPEGRARVAEAALAVIAEHPDELVRDQYLMAVADRTTIDPDRLRALAAGERPPARHAAERGDRADRGERGDRAERRPAPARSSRVVLPRSIEHEALRLAVQRPEEVVDRLHEVLFADEVARATYRALTSATTLNQAIDGAEPAVAALLARLAVEDADADAGLVIAELAREAATRAYLALVAETRRSDDPLRYSDEAQWLRQTIEELRPESTTAVEATSRLVGWLVERFEVGV